jgi:hypothetical protein
MATPDLELWESAQDPELYARLIRMEFCDFIHKEYETWAGNYRPVVKVALQNLLQRIDPDATL